VATPDPVRLPQPAAQRLHPDEAVLPDVLHHQTDFVEVGGDHHDGSRGGRAVEAGENGAEPVVLDLAAEGGELANDDVTDGPFESRRARSVRELLHQTCHPIEILRREREDTGQ
jgi:hypothetical protein